MERHFVFLCTEKKQVYFREELSKTINKLKEDRSTDKSNDVKFVSLHSISVCGKNRTSFGYDAEDSKNVVLLEHNIDVEDPLDQLPLTEELALGVDTENEEFRASDFVNAANCLHKFADTLGAPGSYQVHVVWCIESYIPDPGDICEMYAALHRLQCWHNANIVLATQCSDVVLGWPDALPLQVTANVEKVVEASLECVWRGSLQYGAATVPTVLRTLAGQSALATERSKSGTLHVSALCRAVCRVRMDSVPTLLARPGAVYELHVSPDLSQELAQKAGTVLAALATPQLGTLLRIQYSPSPPSLRGAVRSLTTDVWVKMLQEGVFDSAPDMRLPPGHMLHLLAVAGGRPGAVRVLCLRHPDGLGDDVWRLVSQGAAPTHAVQDVFEDKLQFLLRDTAMLSRQNMRVLAHLQLHLPAQISHRLRDKGNDLASLWEETKDDLEALASQEVLLLLLSAPATPLTASADPPSPVCEAELPRHQWPEYEALARRSRTERDKSEAAAAREGDGVGAALVQLDAAHLCQLFRRDPDLRRCYYATERKGAPSGAAKEGHHSGGATAEVPQDRLSSTRDQYPFKANVSAEEARAARWPESLFVTHHGLHYNKDQRRERYEEECNSAREHLIRRELVAACSPFTAGDVLLRGNTGSRGAPPRPRDDTGSVRSFSSRQDAPVRRSPRKRVMAAPALDSFKTPSLLPPHKKKADAAPLESKPSALLAPKRTSDGKPCELSRRAPARRVAPVLAELSDVHKQKLRGAVLTALEEQGVRMKSPLFKVCFKKLFAVCRPFAADVIGRGSTSRNMEKIARAHVKQVIDFETKLGKR